MRRSLRAFASLLWVAGGIVLMLAGLLGGPSFWYLPCFAVLAPLGLIWNWRPSLAAALSVGPLIAVVGLFKYLTGVWLILLACCVASAIALIAIGLRGSKWLIPLTASLLFVGSSFAVDRLFTNQTVVRKYDMAVALDGRAPWGEVGPIGKDGTLPVVVYRRVGTGYCYLAFESKELREQLRSKSNVAVEYNILIDFGKERGYSVRSIAGELLQDEHKVIRNVEWSDGQILGPGESSVNCP